VQKYSTKKVSAPQAADVNNTPRVLTQVFDRDRDLLGKAALLDPGGNLHLQTYATTTTCDAITRYWSLYDLARGIDNCPSNSAFILGTLTDNRTRGVLYVDPANGFDGRNNKSFIYPQEPGYLVLDVDHGSHLPLLAYLNSKGACYVVSRSASDGLYRLSDGAVLKQGGGVHIYVAIDDLSDTPRIAAVLVEMALANGTAYVKPNKAGHPLVRYPHDASIFSPSRLVFEAKTRLGNGVGQQPRPPAEVHPGTTSNSRIIFPANKHNRGQASNRKKSLLAAYDKTPDAIASTDQAVELVLKQRPGTTRETAQRIVSTQRKTRTLDGDQKVTLSDGTVVTVKEILSNRRQYHEKTCFDPTRPDKTNNPKLAKLFTQQARPTLFSFAGGGVTYFLSHLQQSPDSFCDPAGMLAFILDNPRCVVVSPPGTGKTEIILRLINQELPNDRVLYVTADHRLASEVQNRFGPSFVVAYGRDPAHCEKSAHSARFQQYGSRGCGELCPYYQGCPTIQSTFDAQQARGVIVTHAMYTSISKDQFEKKYGRFGVTVIDEDPSGALNQIYTPIVGVPVGTGPQVNHMLALMSDGMSAGMAMITADVNPSDHIPATFEPDLDPRWSAEQTAAYLAKFQDQKHKYYFWKTLRDRLHTNDPVNNISPDCVVRITSDIQSRFNSERVVMLDAAPFAPVIKGLPVGRFGSNRRSKTLWVRGGGFGLTACRNMTPGTRLKLLLLTQALHKYAGGCGTVLPKDLQHRDQVGDQGQSIGDQSGDQDVKGRDQVGDQAEDQETDGEPLFAPAMTHGAVVGSNDMAELPYLLILSRLHHNHQGVVSLHRAFYPHEQVNYSDLAVPVPVTAPGQTYQGDVEFHYLDPNMNTIHRHLIEHSLIQGKGRQRDHFRDGGTTFLLAPECGGLRVDGRFDAQQLLGPTGFWAAILHFDNELWFDIGRFRELFPGLSDSRLRNIWTGYIEFTATTVAPVVVDKFWPPGGKKTTRIRVVTGKSGKNG